MESTKRNHKQRGTKVSLFLFGYMENISYICESLKFKIMDQNTSLKFTLLFLLIGGIIAVGLSMNARDKPIVAMSKSNYEKQTRTIDSLNNVIDSLQTEIFTLEDGFDYKEHRYEAILFEYEFGISYLKDYHPNAYKDFHRIIGHKEDYSHQTERQNLKRLKTYKEEL